MDSGGALRDCVNAGEIERVLSVTKLQDKEADVSVLQSVG